MNFDFTLTLSVATAHYPEFTCNQPKTMMIKLMRKLWIFLFGAIQKKNQLKMLDDDTKKKVTFWFSFWFFFRKNSCFFADVNYKEILNEKKHGSTKVYDLFGSIFQGNFLFFFHWLCFRKLFFSFGCCFFFMSVHFVFENWFFLFFFRVHVFIFTLSLSHILFISIYRLNKDKKTKQKNFFEVEKKDCLSIDQYRWWKRDGQNVKIAI